MRINIYKKKHKKKISGSIKNYLGIIKFGVYGIKVLESGILLTQEVETIRRVISRITKRLSKFIIRVFFFSAHYKKTIKK